MWNRELSEARFLLLREARLDWDPRKLRDPLSLSWLEECVLRLCRPLPDSLPDSWLELQIYRTHVNTPAHLPPFLPPLSP